MVVRQIYRKLEKHLNKRQVTVVLGMRRVGKSTAVKYLLSKVKHNNKIYIDCEKIEYQTLFNTPSYDSIINELELQGITFNKTAVIVLDEIQLIKNLPSFIKYIYDTYSVKFIVTGSSSYYLKNLFTESLAGRKTIFEMHPLNFNEFLLFRGAKEDLITKYSQVQFNIAWYNKYKEFYKEFIKYGGFPEVVMSKSIKHKKELLSDIINSYIDMDVKLLSDYSLNKDLFNLAKLLSARVGSKIDFTKLSSVAGIDRRKISDYIYLFENTYLIKLVKPFTKNIDKEVSQQPKLYFSDNGLLHALAGDTISSGQLFENAIAIQLHHLFEVNYYQKKTGQEIDFILNKKIATEVKETPILQDLTVLKARSLELGIKKQILIGNNPASNGFKQFLWGGNLY
ncbi:MAG: ATP-binding protein [Bacteroidetes bacterium]|nr:ATP-binding protein [Bacteroidota bacterium]